MKTRCKFKCDAVTDFGESKTVNMSVVTYGPEAENKEFWKWTPSGTFTINCVNPDVNFVPGNCYYLDITEANNGNE